MLEILKQNTVRLFAFICLLVALVRTASGVGLYYGEQAFKRSNMAKALVFLERAEDIDNQNPKLQDLLGQTTWNIGTAEKNVSFITVGRTYFEKLSQIMPFYGKAWLYQARAELFLVGLTGQKLSPEKWNTIRNFLYEAVKKEPGSAWIAYQTGISLLSQSVFLTGEDHAFAVKQLKRSIAVIPINPSRYLEMESPFLKPSLEFLWNQFHDIALLASVVPLDFRSYQVFLAFLDEKGLWEHREPVFTEYLKLEKEYYENNASKGEAFLAAGEYEKAYTAFRKAYWMRNWSYARAKAGILASEFALSRLRDGKHELFHKDYRETLKEVLEEKDQDIDFLLPYLKGPVEKSGKPLLSELYSARLEPVEEKPETVTGRLLPAEWFGEAVMLGRRAGKGRITAGIGLKPGLAKGRLTVTAPDKAAFIVLRLNEKEFAGYFIEPRTSREITFDLQTNGGERWLTVELINDSAIELGNLDITYA